MIVSRSTLAAERLQQCLISHPEFSVTSRVMANGHTDPLHGVTDLPDLLLLHHGRDQEELRFLAEQGPNNQLPLIVCGPNDDPESMRLAMRAGARDYLPETASEPDIVACVSRLREEAARSGASATNQLIVVLNAKGGSGASFIATNLAHGLVTDAGKRVTLVDLDLQFGGLSRYLDITPELGILQALEVATELDDVSAAAYTCEHSSGLRLLAAPSERLTLPTEVPAEKLNALLDVFLSNNDYLVVDSPNRLNSLTEFFLERADKIILIVQQSLPSVQDGARMQQLLTSELMISKKKIEVVINRYSKKAAIELNDIKKALRKYSLVTIPNQYKLVAESIDSGIPIAELAKSAAVTKGIRNLQERLDESESQSAGGFLSRALPNLLRS